MNVFWTATAEAHLEAIYAYIVQDSEAYALSTLIKTPEGHNRSVISQLQDARCPSTISRK